MIRTVKISVCVPATRVDTVLDTVESIRRQSLTDWELTLVTQRPSDNLRHVIDVAAAAGPSDPPPLAR